MASSSRMYAAEAVGTGLLLATVVGSGIMAERLAGGNGALELLGNTIPTGAILAVLITIFGPISGAHFNPAVSMSMGLSGLMPWHRLLPFTMCQVAGGILGVWLAHAMFDLPILQISSNVRWSVGQWLAEAAATYGLVLTIFGAVRSNAAAMPVMVGLYITAAYWFTASTSFANPAVTIARALTDTFSGIAPASAPAFIAAQIAGTVIATITAKWLFAANSAE